ncbi:MAG TPA: hypothetical protein PK286_09445, partial [Devosia sp.]|nr:hypothetical protein [Devosia sp.]
MTKTFAALLLLGLMTATSGAEEWKYEGGGTPIAYVDNGGAQFQFACRGGDLAMGYWVRKPHKQVAAAASMNLAITPDPAKGSTISASAGTSFAQDMPLIHSDGTSMIVRGPVARQWARIAQQAKSALRIAYVQKRGKHEFFDSNDFDATGSSAAIKKVLDR